MKSVLDQLQEVLSKTTTKESWVIEDAKGVRHSLDAGVSGKPVKVKEADIKIQIIQDLFGEDKQRQSNDDLLALVQATDGLIEYFYNTSAYNAKKTLLTKLKEHNSFVDKLDK